ncbi:MAG: hypothetical protein NTU80_14200 [Verrucomicrobia bacterium]|nr:hypothetical protein [Verrucomicrobiota bacterium]
MRINPESSASKDKPSLDQLLALKRAERPDAAFWQAFDERMRQRQLAAMIEPAPWWYGAALFLRRASVRKVFVPVAASACLALFLTLRLGNVDLKNAKLAGVSPSRVVTPAGLEPAAGTQTGSSGSFDGSSAKLATGKWDRITRTDMAATTDSPNLKGLSGTSDLAEDGKILNANQVAAVGPGGLTNVPVKGAALGSETLSTVDSSSSFPATFSLTAPILETAGFSVGESIASIAGTDSAVEDSLGSVNFDAVWEEGIAALPNLETAPLNPRQARLLATVDDAGVTGPTKSLAHVRERVVHRLEANEEFYASASRVGVSGDRLSLRF